MRNKLTSRKFWISVAAFLGSIAASIAGLVTDQKWVTITGIVCGMLSAAIYAAVEAYVDGQHANDAIVQEIIDENNGADVKEN